jgi:sigma-70-like protein
MIDEKSKEQQSGANDKLALFEGVLLPHLHPACNLARWITGNHQDAEDLVQEAYLRALNVASHLFGPPPVPPIRTPLLRAVSEIFYPPLGDLQSHESGPPHSVDQFWFTLSHETLRLLGDLEQQVLQRPWPTIGRVVGRPAPEPEPPDCAWLIRCR